VVKRWSYENSLEQTTEFHLSSEKIETSWSRFKDLYSKYSDKFTYDSTSKFIRLTSDCNVLSEFFLICTHMNQMTIMLNLNTQNL
jgi:hypothetical protein